MPQPSDKTAAFVKTLPVWEEFADALPMKNYQPVPDDWLIAVTDVVQSRQAIKEGRFKPVNMAGVAMISAIMNALGHQDIPYIFGGDGAALACAPSERKLVDQALAKTIAWVEDELALELRAALVPVSEIKKAGLEVLVSAVQVSSAVVNFAFIGGGIAKAEKLMKDGEFRIVRAAGEDYPDLNGLSCRWTPIEEKGNRIISLIVEPPSGETHIPAAIMQEILKLVRGETGGKHPIPKGGPTAQWPPAGLDLEARARRTDGSLFRAKLALYFFSLFAWILFKTGVKYGEFDPVRYQKFTGLNTDYRKIQDGIRMTVSLENASVTRLRDYLESQRSSWCIALRNERTGSGGTDLLCAIYRYRCTLSFYGWSRRRICSGCGCTEIADRIYSKPVFQLKRTAVA